MLQSLLFAYQTLYCDNARAIFLQSLFFQNLLSNAVILHNTTPRAKKTPWYVESCPLFYLPSFSVSLNPPKWVELLCTYTMVTAELNSTVQPLIWSSCVVYLVVFYTATWRCTIRVVYCKWWLSQRTDFGMCTLLCCCTLEAKPRVFKTSTEEIPSVV